MVQFVYIYLHRNLRSTSSSAFTV